MDASPARYGRPWVFASPALASLALAALVVACGPAAADGATAGPVAPVTPPASAAQPPAEASVATPDLTPGPIDVDGLMAIAETLAPPGGVERGRTTSDGSASVRWLTPQALGALQAYYAGVAADGGYGVLVDTEVGGIQSWVFGDIPQAPVNASIQVTPMPGEGHLVMVMITPA